MADKHEGLGILDSEDWDDIKHLDWNEKQSWKTTLAEWKPASPRSLHSPKATWAFRRIRSVVWPRSSGPVAAEKLRKTAYLDGLRGVAAFLVYWHHHELWCHEPSENHIFENAFGYEGQYRFANFHGVRLLFNGGHFAVATFFVVSGYVLSVKPLSLIQAGQQDKLADNLSSALFRRWLRLYMPLAATTFLYMLTWHAFGGLWIQGAEKKGNMRDEIWSWYSELKNFSFVFTTGGEPWFSYNFHLWSIPVEMKGSIVVYTACLALSRATRNARLWCTAGLMFYFLYVADGWYCALFAMGMFLADLDQLAARDELPGPIARLAPYKTFIYHHLLAFAVYLGGVPAQNDSLDQLRRNRGWYYLSLLKPQAVYDYKWFYLFFAAAWLVAAVPRVPRLRRLLEARFCQYLGRVSFALYLVHGPVIWTLGDRLYAAAGWPGNDAAATRAHLARWAGAFPLPRAGPLGLEVAFLLPHLVLLPVTFWCAEMVTRGIDEPAVRFAQWLHGRTLARPPPAAAAAAMPTPLLAKETRA